MAQEVIQSDKAQFIARSSGMPDATGVALVIAKPVNVAFDRIKGVKNSGKIRPNKAKFVNLPRHFTESGLSQAALFS